MYLQTDVWQHWSELLENIYAADMEMKIKTKKNKNTNQHSAMFAWRDYNDYTYSNNTLRNTNYFCVCVCVCALVLCIFRPCTQFFPWMFKRFFFVIQFLIGIVRIHLVHLRCSFYPPRSQHPCSCLAFSICPWHALHRPTVCTECFCVNT